MRQRESYRVCHRALGALFAIVTAVAGVACDRANGDALSSQASFAFVDRDAVYDIATVGGAIIAVGRAGQIFRSEDGGRTWAKVESPTPHDLLSVSFRDGKNGFAVGTQKTLVATEDGGRHWKSVDVPWEEQVFQLTHAPDGSAFAVGVFGAAYRTTGNGWESVTFPWEEVLGAVWEEAGEVYPHLYGVEVIDGVTYAVGEYGLILRSDDRGETWVKQAGGEVSDPHLFSIRATDANQAVAVGQGGTIRVTRDGGETWSLNRPEPVPLYDVLLEGGSIFAFGDLGTILVSSEDGAAGSWKRLEEIDLPTWARFDPVAQQEWIARAIAGANGQILTFGKAGASGFRSDVRG